MCSFKLKQRRLVLLLSDKNATEACRNLVKVFGEGTVSDRTCVRWFEKFEAGDFDINDKPRSGRPSLIDDDIVKIEQDPFLTTSEIEEKLKSAQQTISDHIRQLKLLEKMGEERGPAAIVHENFEEREN
ncbi:hypothetical protein E2986_11272 [Frieseomelitta varia]|uniref:Mos1 transposase HTH domain-containing protein n=1 Tax=Frieseomelitta varia TaxID=561572 RepID=A0A833VVS1_9HYME|nr:hypothetical protein E2986_11272 [Frieseomelitta varia]